MKEHKQGYGVAKTARIFGVSRSGYYLWEKRETSRHARQDAELTALIRKIFEEHHDRYGSPRIWVELRALGRRVSRKRVERLMRERGMRARPPRKRVHTTDSRHLRACADNILDRNFQAAAPGEKWVSDITYLRTSGGWLYLTVILDLWDRKVIGWSMGADLASERVCRALEMAAGNRPAKEGLIFHSDRGIQYCSDEFRGALKQVCPTVRQSMSRKGNCWDNACAESFFKTLKAELDVLEGTHSIKEVRAGVFEYIEMYYNRCRRHSALGYAIPIAFTPNIAA